MKRGIYPGSFDPITNGHMDIIERAAAVVDELVVGVLVNKNKKQGLFTVDERIQMIENSTKHLKNIRVIAFGGLLVDFAEQQNANIIIRGMRAVTDFEYEMQMAQINKNLLPTVETLFLVTSAKFSFLSSSSVRELAMFKGKFHNLVPPYVAKCLEQKY
ncbi:MAG: pantetheine-phosphate adenylyltransferase [Cellulosilyticaceae bacterium]